MLSKKHTSSSQVINNSTTNQLALNHAFVLQKVLERGILIIIMFHQVSVKAK